MPSIADLEAELLDCQRREYAKLQQAAAEVAFERKHGRPAADLAELSAAFKSGTVATVDPTRHLDDATIRRLLTTATG